jgi:phosphatidylglycerol:prolipoprotein diacylglycerol transferase
MYPILFHVGQYPVHSWGVMLMVGFLIGGWRAATRAGRYGLRPEDVWDVALFGLLGGVIGGRIGFVIQEPGFWRDPAQMLAIWKGGMTFYGGLLGGILAGVITCRVKKMNVGDMADLAGVSCPIGYIFGRIGCFLNGCCYGGACSLPWAMRFRADDGTLTPPSHPAQLYSAMAGLIIYLMLLPLERRRAFRGQVMYAFLFLYGVYRFLIEYVRAGASSDSSALHWAITDAQAASLLLCIVAAVIYAVLAVRARQAPARAADSGMEAAAAAAALPPAAAHG